MRVRSTNVNGWCHKKSNRKFSERATLTFALSGQKEPLPDIWGMQEVPTGGRAMPCLTHLNRLAMQNNYRMFLPALPWDPAKHPRSIQNVLLIRNAERVERRTMDMCFSNRYNYVSLRQKGSSGKELSVMNVHIPQISCFPGRHTEDSFVRLRKYQSNEMLESLKREVERNLVQGKSLILMGDFNRTREDGAIKGLLELGLVEAPASRQDTFFFDGGEQGCSVDFILVTEDLACSIEGYEVYDDFAKVHRLSDHAMVDLTIAI